MFIVISDLFYFALVSKYFIVYSREGRFWSFSKKIFLGLVSENCIKKDLEKYYLLCTFYVKYCSLLAQKIDNNFTILF